MHKLKTLLMLIISIVLFSCSSVDLISDKSAVQLTSENLTEGKHQWQNVYGYGDAKFVDDEIHLISTGNWFYLTSKEYRDFIFEAEILMPDVKEYSNSGIIFRAKIKDTDQGKQAVGYQAEVDVSDRKWSGGLYEQGGRQWLHPIHKDRSFPDEDFIENYADVWNEEKANAFVVNQWNKYRVECKGSDIKIYVNGVLTTHVNDVKAKKGFIGIQHHGSHQYTITGSKHNTVRFKNISVTEIEL
jgi:hypothetical protein